jgi:hypothetical protein
MLFYRPQRVSVRLESTEAIITQCQCERTTEQLARDCWQECTNSQREIGRTIGRLRGVVVLAPSHVLGNYGIETSPTLALVGRLFGGVLLTLSVILWLAKDFRDETAVRAG